MTEVYNNDPNTLNALQSPVPVPVKKPTFSRLYGKHDVLDGEYN